MKSTGENNNIIKVVWICHFSNEEVRERLGLSEGRDFAPWITLSIEELEKHNDIDLHVIAPHSGLARSIFYQKNSVHYYFIKTGIPYLKRNWPKFFKWDFWTKYNSYSKSIVKTVRRINPEIINLHGAENPHYSSSILRLKDYKILINIQGIFSSIKKGEIITPFDKYRSKIENRIYSEFKHFGIRASFMEEYITRLNPSAKYYHQVYPIKNVFDFDPFTQQKKYDVVFFARIDKEKGIEDLIDAIYIAKKTREHITLCVIGPGTHDYIAYIKRKILKLDLDNNVIFKGPLDTQDEVHLEASKAKISVLPTRNDTIPGTVVESLFLGLPVISYPVGGIPSINENDRVITFAKIGDSEHLAYEIINLLNNDRLRNELSIASRKIARNTFDNTKLMDDLIRYYSIIAKHD